MKRAVSKEVSMRAYLTTVRGIGHDARKSASLLTMQHLLSNFEPTALHQHAPSVSTVRILGAERISRLWVLRRYNLQLRREEMSGSESEDDQQHQNIGDTLKKTSDGAMCVGSKQTLRCKDTKPTSRRRPSSGRYSPNSAWPARINPQSSPSISR